MASGFFAGGLAKGLQAGFERQQQQQKIDLQRRQVKAEEAQTKIQTESNKAVLEALDMQKATKQILSENMEYQKGLQTASTLNTFMTMDKNTRKAAVDTWINQQAQKGVNVLPEFANWIKQADIKTAAPTMQNVSKEFMAGGMTHKDFMQIATDPQAFNSFLVQNQKSIANPIQRAQQKVNELDQQIKQLENAQVMAVNASPGVQKMVEHKLNKAYEMRNKWQSFSQSGKRRNVVAPGSTNVESAIEVGGRLIDPSTGEAMPEHVIAPQRMVQAPTMEQAVSGLPKGKEGDVIRDITAQEIATKNVIGQLDDLDNYFRSPEFVGGAFGKGIVVLNDVIQGLGQLTNQPFTKGGKFNDDLLDPNASEETIGFFRKAAIEADTRDAMVARLAYVIAKQLDPAGRISDRDREEAERMVRSADPKAGLQKTANMRRTMNRELRTTKEVTARNIPSLANQPALQVSPQSTPPSVEDMTDEEYVDWYMSQ